MPMTSDELDRKVWEEWKEKINAHFNYFDFLSRVNKRMEKKGLFCFHRIKDEEGYWLSTGLIRYATE